MYRTTKNFQYARSLTDAMLVALKTAAEDPLLTTPKVDLIVDGPAPGPDSEVADFTKASFTGYTAHTATLSVPVGNLLDDRALIDNAEFIATDDVDPTQEAKGWILTDGADAYYGGELFEEPVPFSVAGDYLSLDVVLPLPTKHPVRAAE